MRIAQQAGMTRIEVLAGNFLITAFQRISDPSAPVVVYIEGDGLAWKSRSEPSLDPTPRNPLGLRLAAIDRSPNVVYLARLCQYSRSANCAVEYWTSKRFSEEVVAATDRAIDRLNPSGAPVHLVGYSGGAAVAMLVAARRSDVASIRTVAGNLDSEAVNRYHRVSAMPTALNPADMAERLSQVPQRHFIGERDAVVPSFIAEDHARRSKNNQCVSVVLIPKAKHSEGWEEAWSKQVATLPTCQH